MTFLGTTWTLWRVELRVLVLLWGGGSSSVVGLMAFVKTRVSVLCFCWVVVRPFDLRTLWGMIGGTLVGACPIGWAKCFP